MSFAGELGADAVHPEHDGRLFGRVPLECQGVEEAGVAAEVNDPQAGLEVDLDDVLFGVLLAPVPENFLLTAEQTTLLQSESLNCNELVKAPPITYSYFMNCEKIPPKVIFEQLTSVACSNATCLA